MTKDIVGRLRFTLLRGEDWPPSLHAACDRYEAAVNDEAPIETLKDAKRAFGVEMLALDKWRRPTFYAKHVESLSPPDGVITSAELLARTAGKDGKARPIFGKEPFPAEAREPSPFLSPPDGVGLTDDDPFVLSIAEAIARQGVGRPWADFDEVDAFDLDQSDLICYAKAAAGVFTTALAAEKARGDGLDSELDTANREIGNLGRRMRSYHERAERMEAALEKIACRHVTVDPLWWQMEARAALSVQPEEG